VFNLASIKTSGFDIESSYRFEMPNVPGRFTVRGLATNTHKFVTNPGIPGAVAIDSAGPELRRHAGLEVPGHPVLGHRPLRLQRPGALVQRRPVRRHQYITECKAGSCPVGDRQNNNNDDRLQPP
jgi:iron complex outermembrane receptor protein